MTVAATVLQALAARRSVRAFTGAPVGREAVEAILADARTAPSGANLQPGRFVALTGEPLASLIAALDGAIDGGRPEVSEYGWFPEPMPKALRQRQVAAGRALYDALGIGRGDRAAREAQFRRNYRFFDAPVGIVVTIDRRMGQGCWMDLGMSVMALLLSAEARGLAACGIGALATRADVVQETLGLPAEEMVVCGIALGLADPHDPVNGVRTERLPHGDFSQLRGF